MRNDRQTVLEEVEFMLEASESPHTIADMLGIKAGSVARALLRAGRPDLSNRFETARRSQESHPCADCGARVSWRTAERCRPCGNRHRERIRREGDAQHCPRHGCRRYLNADGRCSSHGRAAVAA